MHDDLIPRPHFLPPVRGLEAIGEGEGFTVPLFSPAMMRRIQACVAACEGFSTEQLEAGIIQEMQRTLVQGLGDESEVERLLTARGTPPHELRIIQ
jgi:hypothetical protein